MKSAIGVRVLVLGYRDASMWSEGGGFMEILVMMSVWKAATAHLIVPAMSYAQQFDTL